MTDPQNFPSDQDPRLTGAFTELGNRDAQVPTELARQRHLQSMRSSRNKGGISRLVGIAAAIVLVSGSFITFQRATQDQTTSINVVAELQPLKKVADITTVPFERTEKYLLLDVTASQAETVGNELTNLLGAAPSVIQNGKNGTTYVVPTSVARKLSNTQGVTATPDTPVKATVDQSPTPSWGLDRIDATTVSLDNKYTYYSTGASSYAYVIDTGIYSGNADIAGRVISGYTAVADGNGTEDCNGHGTHVAGTIAGNSFGVAKTTRVVAVRVLDCAGSGFTSSVIAGINWVIASHPGGSGVINLSLGGGANSALDTAVANATAAGLTVIVAAGNNGADACSYSPARAPSAITVGAINNNDTRASYSNFGSCVDVFAPGTGITSAWIGGANATNTISGTSMATPHVVGLAARLAQAYPGITSSEIVSKLTAGTSGSLAVTTFAEADPITTTTTASTSTTGAPSTTSAPIAPTTTTVAVPPITNAPTTTTTVVRSTTTTTLAKKKGGNDRRKPTSVVTPREFSLGYKLINSANTLTASWIDDQTPESYRIACGKNAGKSNSQEQEEVEESANLTVVIEKAQVLVTPSGRSEVQVSLPPVNEALCWIVASIGDVSSGRSNVAVVPKQPKAPKAPTTTAPPITTSTTSTSTTSTTSTTTTTAPPVTRSTTVEATKANPGASNNPSGRPTQTTVKVVPTSPPKKK